MTDSAPKELAALRKVATWLADEQDPRRLVPLILDEALALVGAERGFAILLGANASFEIAAARNLDRETILQPGFKVSRSIVQRVSTSGRPELISDAREDPTTRDIPSVRELELRSVLCVPLRVHGRTLGALYVDHRYLKRKFDAEDLATLERFSVAAATSLESARRLEELARSRDELARRVETIERLRADLAARYRESSREANRLRDEAARARARDPAPDDPGLPGIVARSGAMRRVLQVLRKAAASDAPVLILGQTGVGKEVLARALHQLSARQRAPFVAENCAALADPLLESEIFGHEAGAFTGAVQAHAGLFERAAGGTVFLDEVGEMSPGFQAKLLRVLQELEVRRVGGRDTVRLDVRIVAATHRDLEQMVAQGSFRADLFYRLNVVRLEIPPLRERPEDVPVLLDRFLEAAGGDVAIEPQARELLLAHAWPGNVRELENEVRRLVVLAGRGGTIRPGLLSPAIVGRPAAAPVASAEPAVEEVRRIDDIEREMIERAMRRTRGNKTLAAKLLGIPKTSLYHKLERYGAPLGEEPRETAE